MQLVSKELYVTHINKLGKNYPSNILPREIQMYVALKNLPKEHGKIQVVPGA